MNEDSVANYVTMNDGVQLKRWRKRSNHVWPPVVVSPKNRGDKSFLGEPDLNTDYEDLYFEDMGDECPYDD